MLAVDISVTCRAIFFGVFLWAIKRFPNADAQGISLVSSEEFMGRRTMRHIMQILPKKPREQACPIDFKAVSTSSSGTACRSAKGTLPSATACCAAAKQDAKLIAQQNPNLFVSTTITPDLNMPCKKAYQDALANKGMTTSVYSLCPDVPLFTLLELDPANSCPSIYIAEVNEKLNLTTVSQSCRDPTSACDNCAQALRNGATELAGGATASETVTTDCFQVMLLYVAQQESGFVSPTYVALDACGLFPPRPSVLPPAPAPSPTKALAKNVTRKAFASPPAPIAPAPGVASSAQVHKPLSAALTLALLLVIGLVLM